ncbi:MAG TPA: MazG-like family protein [Candidatus Saccharimonadales bacterium]|nr:MazG-like family protein [Candidatus Saccharimonadales bacterium]
MSKAPAQQEISLETLNQIIWKHLEARDWHRNKSRGLAISLALEANELLEHYQWGEEPVGGRDAIAEELADVLIYAFQIAQQNDIDIADHIKKKLEKAAAKYPAEAFKGKLGKEHSDAWFKHKMDYKKKGL